MQPVYPILQSQESAPNMELLRRMGWSVGSASGDYCLAWRGRDEVVFEWRSGSWHRVGGRGGIAEI
jgi:hypothetical protein